ncbi:histidine decarboxylase [Dyadobacter alkalitolerans]|uniref:histidine decarboxylase n=1 Tax=Dyadobacter alkalitolerans TaxID=492736 RepID=UPI000417AD48|nr:histidine decarboxylase [Dyadobacter alkalitolerans]
MNVYDRERLVRYMELMAQKASTSIGYPFAQGFNYSELHPLLLYPLINLGDPFTEGNYGVNSFALEREVIEFFADLFRAPKNNVAGYVTSGGSESNLYGLYVAREVFPKGKVYYSSATHYSIAKSVRILNMESVVIPVDQKGEMDYDYLRDQLRQNRHIPAIVIANIGTTMTEAKDDLPTIRAILGQVGVDLHYIHCDAALSGAFLPLLTHDPTFDFHHGADSIACSGHKFIGSPIPCGVVIVKKDYRDLVGERISYIGSLDTTITGSRNGLNPVVLWYAIKQQGRENLLRKAEECLSLAAYTENKLREYGFEAWRNTLSLTVVFPQPSELVCKKWQLATQAKQAHLICMPGISKQVVDAFLKDMLGDRLIQLPAQEVELSQESAA